MENNAMVLHDPNVSLGLQKVADGLFKSGMFPNAKNAFGAYAIVQYGHELGIPPMMAFAAYDTRFFNSWRIFSHQHTPNLSARRTAP